MKNWLCCLALVGGFICSAAPAHAQTDRNSLWQRYNRVYTVTPRWDLVFPRAHYDSLFEMQHRMGNRDLERLAYDMFYRPRVIVGVMPESPLQPVEYHRYDPLAPATVPEPKPLPPELPVPIPDRR